MKLILKVDADGKPVLDPNGNLIFINADTKEEQAIDVGAAVQSVNDLKDETIQRRQKNTALGGLLEPYKMGEKDGQPVYLDAEAAKTAMETVKNFDDKKLLDAKEVEKLKASMQIAYVEKENEINKGWQSKVAEMEKTLGSKNGTIFELMVVSEFAKSPTVNKKLLLPPDIAAGHFGKHFKVEGEGKDAKVIGYFGDEKILSKIKPGTPAEFEEALGVVIDNYPMKDQILRSGDGGSGSTGGGGGTGKMGGISPEDFAKLPASEKLRIGHEVEAQKKAANN